jgi:hypothetical protein
MDNRLNGTTRDKDAQLPSLGKYGGVRFAWELSWGTSECCEHVWGRPLHCTIAHTFDLDFILNVQLLTMHLWNA